MGEEHREESISSHLQRSLQRIETLNSKFTVRLKDVDESIDKVEKIVNQLSDATQKVLDSTENIKQQLQQVLKAIGNPNANVMQIQFEGDTTMAGGKLSKGQTIAASGIETDAFGKAVTIDPANASWSIDDPSIASFVQNADGSATFTPLAAGDTIVRLTDNSTSAVGTNTLTVSGGPDVLTLTFGDPQAATPAAQ